MEIWEIIEDFPSYSINELGEVYSHISNIIMKPGKDKYGYFRVNLCKDKKKYTKLVHRLLAQAFILNPENKLEVDHIDRDKTNNNVSNLRWATHKENNGNKGYYHHKQDGLHNITLNKRCNSYSVKIIINSNRHRKTFKILEEAIEYRDKYMLDNPK